jgi:putative DNA primase/helicase
MTAVAPSKDKPETWLRCLKDWTGGDQPYEHFLQQWSGYCATASTREQKFCFAHGAGANGKTTYINTVAGIQNNYSQVVPPEVFAIPRGGGTSHPTGLASLVGCRLGFANETEANSTWALSQVKGLVAGDPILARYMRQDYFQFTPCAKLFVVGNHRPMLSSVDEAVKRRLILLPFEVTIPAEKRDQKLGQKLRAEWGGILQWIIDGAVDWHRNGLQLPECVKVATEEYVDSQDIYGHWIAERCMTGPNYRAKAASLYASWLDFCTVNNTYKVSQRVFLSSLLERPNIKRKHTEGGNFYEGIGLNHHKDGYES